MESKEKEKIYVVDIETDGLKSKKIHVMSIGFERDGEWVIKSTNDYDVMRRLLSSKYNTIVGHNFKLFDSIELERVLNVDIKARIIDTLPLTWYIYPEREQGTFGLAAFGEELGIPKPIIDDWEGLTYKQYAHRCEEDVKINIKLWEDIQSKMMEIYQDYYEMRRFIKYLMFKMDCLVHQKKVGIHINVEAVKKYINILEDLYEPKQEALRQVMPKTKVLYSKPAKMFKIDGTPSAASDKWYERLRERGLPLSTEEIYEEPNINSVKQVKDWLFSLGWKPRIYLDGTNGKVPQIRNGSRDLCESVLDLIGDNPSIEALDGVTVISHRLAILRSLLENVDEDGKVISSMHGLTNTLRLRHAKPIVNLPGVTGAIEKAMQSGKSEEEAIAENLRDGHIIRSCIIAPEGYELCGSDITSLEDNTKRHYMWDYDPEYVIEQMVEGYDPHLDLAIRAGALTKEQLEEHNLYGKTEGKEGKSYKKIRDIYKVANYSCIYGVGATKLAEATRLPVGEAKKLIEAYWERNWSIAQLPNDMITKTVHGSMWLLNPVNRFWYSLRNERDIFSTLNQGTGAFVFDCWLQYMSRVGVKPILQYHDEILTLCKIGEREETKKKIRESMVKVNEALNLNVEITVDVKFGKTYKDVH